MRGQLGFVVVLGCSGSSPKPPPPPAPMSAVACASLLRERYQIDVSPEPRICAPLVEALRPLGPQAVAAARGIAIRRDARGPCDEPCPNLAAELMSDAALAYFETGARVLHVVDATFDGPRWRGGHPSPDKVRGYLAALGVDWSELVERVRRIPGVSLPATMPVGDPAVFDAIVRHGPAFLLGGDISLVDLLRHELGHALLLHPPAESSTVEAWSTVAGWTESDGERADGYVGGRYASEQPIVASRLALGLPRGAGPHYVLAGGAPTKYATFDPIEDHGEAFRLVHSDPVALGAASPGRLLVVAAGEISLRQPALRRFIVPGIAALMKPHIDPVLAMATLRAHGDTLLPEAIALADARPLVIPADLAPEDRAAIEQFHLVVEIGGHRFRPTDAMFAAFVAQVRQLRRDADAFQRGLPGQGP